MPAPSELSIGINDIVKAERNARGTMIKELITTKRKIEASWTVLTAVQMASLLTAVSANFFTVVYLDPQTNANRSASFYSGDRTVPVLFYKSGVPLYKDLSISLVER